MAWIGVHPTSTRADALNVLPPRPCALCVYRMRVALDGNFWWGETVPVRRSLGAKRDGRCDRCGINWDKCYEDQLRLHKHEMFVKFGG